MRSFPKTHPIPLLIPGDSMEDTLAEFTDLEREDILAAIAYANTVVKTKNISHRAAS